MATRCSIGIKTKDNKFKAIYCHYDGYIEWVGSVLVENYNTEEQVKKLLELGNLSSLRETLDTCVAYHRDRGEELQPAKVFDTQEKMQEHFDNCWCEYFYLFDNGEWYVSDDYEYYNTPVKSLL